MSNELYEHKRSDTVKWVLTLIAFIVVGVMLAGIILGWFEKSSSAEEQEQAAVIDGDGNAMDAGTLYRMPEKMTFTAAGSGIPLAQFGEPEGTTSTARAEVRIEAYVILENANNREVDFSVAWGDSAQRSAEPVTNYVTVTPQSDGSRIATVACKQGFGDDTILITVTTRDGGFQAVCTVMFEGAPSSLKFMYNDTEYSSSSEITVQANAEYSVKLSLWASLGKSERSSAILR